MYNPQPIDTTNVEVPNELLSLAETLAKNTHENWALARMNEGWQYGRSRDDLRKIHPCIVPYKKLPKSEKEYDRRTSMETIRLILSLGFTIKRGKI